MHVSGVPYPLRHFLGLWAVGTLIGTTIDVDLHTLRRRGIVRIRVGMASASSFDKRRDELGPFIKSDGVLMLKGYDFVFRPEPADFVPEPDFVPFAWDRKDKDDSSDRGVGGDAAGGQESGNCPPTQTSDGDTVMTAAHNAGAGGRSCLMDSVQALLSGWAVLHLSPRPQFSGATLGVVDDGQRSSGSTPRRCSSGSMVGCSSASPLRSHELSSPRSTVAMVPSVTVGGGRTGVTEAVQLGTPLSVVQQGRDGLEIGRASCRERV